jgi:NAD(P)-dependent dehydrogenase (short-subunit alcohol dehydrogenase family)
MIDLREKVILVTGGSRGIGAVTVRTLAKAGAHVILHYGRSRADAEVVAAQCPAGQCHLVAGDLADPRAPAAIWQEAWQWRGRVHALVNNAAVAVPAGVEDQAWGEVWERTLRVNVIAAADLCREAILHFRDVGRGTIVNVASRAAFRGDEPNYMQYAASKAGLIALTKSIARGFAREGIVAYGVAPGWVRTEMAEPAIAERGMAALMRDVPMGEMAPPEDVANVIAFLVSGLARHATGTTIDVNGASYVR